MPIKLLLVKRPHSWGDQNERGSLAEKRGVISGERRDVQGALPPGDVCVVDEE